MRLTLVLGLAFGLTACGSWGAAKRDLTVGHVPCSPALIETDESTPETGPGWRQWDASCNGVQYRCTQRSTGGAPLTPTHATECVPASSIAG